MTLTDERALERFTSRGRPAWSWSSGACAALEHRFELVMEAPELRDGVKAVVAPFRVLGGETPGRVDGRYEIRSDRAAHLPHTLYYEGTRLASGRVASDLTEMLAWHINRSVIERSVSRYVLLHAAAAVRGGVTVILPADQESGKTTTVAGLLREGFDYLTDEAVALHGGTGHVTPFPKTLSLDPGSWPLFPECRPTPERSWRRQWQVPVQHLGARSLHTPAAPPKVIVFPQYVRGADTAVVAMSGGEAVRELARMSFHFPTYAARNLALFSRLVRRATTARLVVGSLEAAVMAIERLVSDKILEDM